MRLNVSILMLVLSVATCGCNRGPFTRGQPQVGLQSGQQQANIAQIQQLQQRLAQLDASNQDMHAQSARVEIVKEENGLLRKQLADMARQVQTEQAARKEVDQRLAGHQASMRQRGSATISANNSVLDKLQVADIPGFKVDQDGDVIRIQLPSDEIFTPGTAQLKLGASEILSRVATAIAQNYAKQIVGIEGHTDNTPLALGVSHHQLTVSQSLAVFQQLTSGGNLSTTQLFVMGNGANHPRFSNGDSDGRKKNRRIELVIYPETVN